MQAPQELEVLRALFEQEDFELSSVEWTRRVAFWDMKCGWKSMRKSGKRGDAPVKPDDFQRFSWIFDRKRLKCLEFKASSHVAKPRGPWCCGRRHFWWAGNLRNRPFQLFSSIFEPFSSVSVPNGARRAMILSPLNVF